MRVVIMGSLVPMSAINHVIDMQLRKNIKYKLLLLVVFYSTHKSAVVQNLKCSHFIQLPRVKRVLMSTPDILLFNKYLQIFRHAEVLSDVSGISCNIYIYRLNIYIYIYI